MVAYALLSSLQFLISGPKLLNRERALTQFTLTSPKRSTRSHTRDYKSRSKVMGYVAKCYSGLQPSWMEDANVLLSMVVNRRGPPSRAAFRKEVYLAHSSLYATSMTCQRWWTHLFTCLPMTPKSTDTSPLSLTKRHYRQT